MSTTRNGPIGVVTTAALYAFGAVAVVHGQPPADGGPDPNLVRLEREIGRLAPRAGGTVGVAAIHLESDRHVYLNGDVRFPMASTYKIPIAIHALRLVDEGVLSLDSMVALQAGDLHRAYIAAIRPPERAFVRNAATEQHVPAESFELHRR